MGKIGALRMEQENRGEKSEVMSSHLGILLWYFGNVQSRFQGGPKQANILPCERFQSADKCGGAREIT